MNRRSPPAGLIVILFVIVTVIVFFALVQRLHDKGQRDVRAVMELREASSAALKAVYPILVAVSSTSNGVVFQPNDIRRVLTRELPPSVLRRGIYIPTEVIPQASGKFICFVYLADERVFPYGLTSSGDCRYARPEDAGQKQNL